MKNFPATLKIILLWLTSLTSAPVLAQVADVDGNTYPTVRIGSQEWMAENLRTSRFNNGDSILEEEDNAVWPTLTEPGMCWYDNDSATHHFLYGRIYNGYVAMDPDICPAGWSVPSEQDWDKMISSLGGASMAGGKLKQAGTEHWEEPNTGATNNSGFTALPGGFRSHADGTFNYRGQRAGWFVTTPGSGVLFKWVSWSLESSGSGPIAPEAGLAIRCFRNVSVSIDGKAEAAKMKVYPIPASGALMIERPGTPQTKRIEAVLTDATGRIVKKEWLLTDVHALDVTGLANGTYLLQLIANDAVIHFEKVVLIK
ncbi:MAG: FISUMP domain-containing protein [Bacteroidia bacterium]